jgi:DNA polymerase-3 subunit alpha
MAKLKRKTVKNYSGNVYDLTVDKTHSYNINGLSVHNSAAGCLLSWTLGIVDLDPIRFGLYFERFMNPERKSSPDIDLDLESGTDHLTNEFFYSKYGKERVFPVITFYTFNEKGCIKDVTRALGQDTGFSSDVFAATKEMPDKWGCTLEEWVENYTKDEFANQKVVDWLKSPKTKDIISNTLKLQGNIRSLGKHAAGVIITPSPIWNYIPVNIVSGEIVSGFQESGSGKDLSDLGILKLDRLNLTTLNIIKQTIQNVKKTQGKDISEDVRFLDIENPELFHELKNGFNSGIFQFESDGITHLAKSIDVETFDEVVATTSLYRPGPMGVNAHNDYIKNKFHPEQIEYVNDKLAPLLKKTKGVLIYQEQLMFIAKEIGGMTLGEGDNLRKVMDKASKIIGRANSGEELSEKDKNDKSYKEYLKLWDKFKEGAGKNGYEESEIKDIEAWLVKYLGYSFNKCLTKNHSVESKERGFINILDVEVGEEILGFNEDKKTKDFFKVKKIHKNGTKRVYKIKTKSGKFLECTLDHKIMTPIGMKTLKEILEKKLEVLI